MVRAGCALILLWLAGNATAKDIGGEYAVHGVGGEPCSTYQSARNAGGGRQLEYEVWLSGYFSAFNLIVSNTYSIMGERGIEQFIEALDEYCAAHLDELFVTAISSITMVVFPERQNLSPYVDRWPSLVDEVGKQGDARVQSPTTLSNK